MKKVSNLLFYGKEIDYRVATMYDYIEDCRTRYGVLRDNEESFPFNYGITVDDMYNDNNLQFFIERMGKLGIDFSTINPPKWYDSSSTVYTKEQVVRLQSLVRFIFRFESIIEGRTTSKLDGDSKSVRLSDYIEFFLNMSDFKIDTGTFIESLNLKMSAEKPWEFILYDNKDIPTGYRNNLVTSCMTSSASNGISTMDFYTMFDNIRLLAIKQDGQEISRCLLWKVGKDKWIADRIYMYKQAINMREKVYDMLNKEVSIYNVSKGENETIKIIDMRKNDNVPFQGFLKGKIYASVQHLTGDIYPTTISPFFDSARIAVIHGKYYKSITFVFCEDQSILHRRNSSRNIPIRDREETLMREWVIFNNGKPITNKSSVLFINNTVFMKGSIPLFLNDSGAISVSYDRPTNIEMSLIKLPKRLRPLLDSIEVKDMDGNNVDIFSGYESIDVWVDNKKIVYATNKYILKEDAVIIPSKSGRLSFQLNTGTNVYGDIVSLDDISNYAKLTKLYSVVGHGRGISIYVDIDKTVTASDGSILYKNDTVEINGQYYLYDNKLRGIENDQCSL